MMRISVVIPTRNRRDSLLRLLASLSRQQRLPDEVVVVDASDDPLPEEELRSIFPTLPARCLHHQPSVCAQRNTGISEAQGTHIFLCDDDMEAPANYLSSIAAHLERHPYDGAVSGVVSEADAAGIFTGRFPAIRPRALVWCFIFQLTVWGDISLVTGRGLAHRMVFPLRAWYRNRGNTTSLAGWPLVTSVHGAFFRTAFYGLGAAVIRRDWLLASPFNEALDAHGIGDNYGAALGFPGGQPIVVLNTTVIRHHKIQENRLSRTVSHVARIRAMRAFLRQRGLYSFPRKAFLFWSIVGNIIRFLLRGDRQMSCAAISALRDGAVRTTLK